MVVVVVVVVVVVAEAVAVAVVVVVVAVVVVVVVVIVVVAVVVAVVVVAVVVSDARFSVALGRSLHWHLRCFGLGGRAKTSAESGRFVWFYKRMECIHHGDGSMVQDTMGLMIMIL